MESLDGWTAASTVLTAFSTVAAAIAATAALRSLHFARRTVEVGAAGLEAAEQTVQLAEVARRESELARIDAEQARRDAARDRDANDQERLRQRLQVVSDLVEQIFWAAQHEIPGAQDQPASLMPWRALCNRLRHELVGISDRLPKCADVWLAMSASMAMGSAGMARGEIEAALGELSGVDTLNGDP